jgi:hypothetical protein
VLVEAKLYFYESEQSEQQKALPMQGVVSFAGRCDVVTLDGAKRRKQNIRESLGFEVMAREGCIIRLSAGDGKERAAWVNAFRSAIDTEMEQQTRAIQEERSRKKELKERSKNDMAQNCEAFGAGLFGATVGEIGRVTIQVNDETGQPVTEGGDLFAATLENDELYYDLQTLDKEDGSYTLTYCAVMAGTFELHIVLHGYDIYGSPFSVNIQPAAMSLAHCVGAGEGLVTAYRDNRKHCFQLLSRDLWGNQLLGGGQPFNASLTGPAELTAFCDDGNGSYSGTYVVKAEINRYLVEGQAPLEISITYGRNDIDFQPEKPQHVSGSPYRPTIVEPPPPSMPPPAPELAETAPELFGMPLPPPPADDPPPLPPAEISVMHPALALHPAALAVAPPLQEAHQNLSVEEVHQLLLERRSDIEGGYMQLSAGHGTNGASGAIGASGTSGVTKGDKSRLASAAAVAKRVRPAARAATNDKKQSEYAALELTEVCSGVIRCTCSRCCF